LIHIKEQVRKTGGMAQVVEYLPHKCQTLEFKLQYHQKKERKKEKERGFIVL
jgi:hypothetical protein